MIKGWEVQLIFYWSRSWIQSIVTYCKRIDDQGAYSMNKCFIGDGCWLVTELNERKIGFNMQVARWWVEHISQIHESSKSYLSLYCGVENVTF
jgi:hypothetical protein